MNLLWLVIIVLLVLAFLGAPGYGPWGGRHTYGWGPSGGLGVVVLILVILLVLGKL